MKNKYLIIILFILLVNISFAVPPFQQELFPDVGLYLEITDKQYHQINKPHYIHTHVYNTTSGKILLGSQYNCSYHAYFINENLEDYHIKKDSTSFYGAGQNATLEASLFNETGEYAVLLWCYTENAGGFIKYNFHVTETGQELKNDSINLLINVLICLVLCIIFVYLSIKLIEGESFKLSILCAISAIYQILLSLGLLYANQLNESIDLLVKINFWSLTIFSVFVVGVLLLYFMLDVFKFKEKSKKKTTWQRD